MKKKSRKQFSKEALKTIRKTGAITATSKYSVRKMLNAIDFSRDLIVVELGVGNGVVTKEIMRRLGKNSRLIALDINENMVELAREGIPQDDRLDLRCYSAFEVDKLLSEYDIQKADVFVSTLPLTIFSKEDSKRILSLVSKSLVPSGKFIQVQYSPIRYPQIRKYFPKVKLGFVIANFPPAFVYFCSMR